MAFSVSLEDSRVIYTKVILLVLVRALPCTGMLWNIKQYSLNAQKCGYFSFTGVHCPVTEEQMLRSASLQIPYISHKGGGILETERKPVL